MWPHVWQRAHKRAGKRHEAREGDLGTAQPAEQPTSDMEDHEAAEADVTWRLPFNYRRIPKPAGSAGASPTISPSYDLQQAADYAGLIMKKYVRVRHFPNGMQGQKEVSMASALFTRALTSTMPQVYGEDGVAHSNVQRANREELKIAQQDMIKRLKNADTTTVMLHTDTEAVALATFGGTHDDYVTGTAEKVFYLYDLYVHTKVKCLRIGAALEMEFVEAARHFDYQIVRLRVDSRNTQANVWYEDKGYHTVKCNDAAPDFELIKDKELAGGSPGSAVAHLEMIGLLQVGPKYFQTFNPEKATEIYKVVSYHISSPRFQELKELLIGWANALDVPLISGEDGGQDAALIHLVEWVFRGPERASLDGALACCGRATVLFRGDGAIVGLILANQTVGHNRTDVHTFHLRAINKEVRRRRLAQWMYESYLLAWKVQPGATVRVQLKSCGTRGGALHSWEKDGFNVSHTGQGEFTIAPGKVLSARQICERRKQWNEHSSKDPAPAHPDEAVPENAGVVAAPAQNEHSSQDPAPAHPDEALDAVPDDAGEVAASAHAAEAPDAVGGASPEDAEVVAAPAHNDDSLSFDDDDDDGLDINEFGDFEEDDDPPLGQEDTGQEHGREPLSDEARGQELNLPTPTDLQTPFQLWLAVAKAFKRADDLKSLAIAYGGDYGLWAASRTRFKLETEFAQRMVHASRSGAAIVDQIRHAGAANWKKRQRPSELDALDPH